MSDSAVASSRLVTADKKLRLTGARKPGAGPLTPTEPFSESL